MIWRMKRGWVLRVHHQYFVVSETGVELATYAPAHFLIAGRTYFVNHYVRFGQLVARTAADEPWGRCHEISVLERKLVEDVSPETRQRLRAFQLPFAQSMLDDLDARNGVPRNDPPPTNEHMQTDEAFFLRTRSRESSRQAARRAPMLWRSRRGMVLRFGDRYYVRDQTTGSIEVHEPTRFVRNEQTYFVDHYVKSEQLVARIALGQRWGTHHEKTVLESKLQEEMHPPTGELRQFMLALGRLPPITDHEPTGRELWEVLAATPTPATEAPIELPPDVERAQQLLLENRNDSLSNSMLSTLRAVAQAGSAFALTAFARASLLYLRERDAPKIDETWTPIQSPHAREVALLVDRLDERDARDAADAMETCAALLGYRDGFPVIA